MSEKRLVKVPGTGLSIELGTKLVRGFVAEDGSAGPGIVLPAPLPIQFGEIVKPSPNSAHWLSEAFGPRIDPDGFIFLGRAIREVGGAIFGNEWIGCEPGVNFWLQPLSDRQSADFSSKSVSQYEKLEALRLLEKDKPPRNTGWDYLRDDQWKKAQAMREQALKYVRPARERCATILEAFERAIVKGTLVVRLQAIEGGALGADRVAEEWLAPHATLLARFLTCRMSPNLPMAADGASHWIFVSHAGLRGMLSDFRKRGADAAEAAKPKPTRAYIENFKERVRDAVRARPEGPPEREKLIREGRDIYLLSKEDAETAYKDAVDSAGVPHEWSKPGRRKA